MLKTTVRPEFLNRIDEIIMFDPLTQNDIRDILHIQMKQLQNKLSEEGVTIEFTKAFEDHMVTGGYDPAYGARPVKRFLQRNVETELAGEIIKGSVKDGDKVLIDCDGDKLTFTAE